MAVDPRAKGARGETVVRDALRKATGLKWERTPGSGALDPKHQLKGDLYVPGEGNLYCVEVKNYEESPIDHGLLSSKSPLFITFWEQTVRQAKQVDKLPLLIFKHNRSKLFVAFTDFPEEDFNHLYLSRPPYECFIALLDDWLEYNTPKFIK